MHKITHCQEELKEVFQEWLSREGGSSKHSVTVSNVRVAYCWTEINTTDPHGAKPHTIKNSYLHF